MRRTLFPKQTAQFKMKVSLPFTKNVLSFSDTLQYNRSKAQIQVNILLLQNQFKWDFKMIPLPTG